MSRKIEVTVCLTFTDVKNKDIVERFIQDALDYDDVHIDHIEWEADEPITSKLGRHRK